MVTASCSYCNCFYFNYSMCFKKIPRKTSGDTNYGLSCKLTLQLILVTVMSLNDSEPTLINQLTHIDGPPPAPVLVCIQYKIIPAALPVKSLGTAKSSYFSD